MFDRLPRSHCRVPAPDSKCELFDLTVQGGGPVATALVALSRWGMRCAFAGWWATISWAQDPGSLDAEGIDTTGLMSARHRFSVRVHHRRTRIGTSHDLLAAAYRPPARAGRDQHLPAANSQSAPHGRPVSRSLAGGRRRRPRGGVEVVVDAGSMRDGMFELARSCGHFIASETFLRRSPRTYHRSTRVAASPISAHRWSRSLSAGAVRRARRRPCDRAARAPVEAVDTTGCGDVFHAGYIYGLLQAWDVERRLEFGRGRRRGWRSGWAGAPAFRRYRTGVAPTANRNRSHRPPRLERKSRTVAAVVDRDGDES